MPVIALGDRGGLAADGVVGRIGREDGRKMGGSLGGAGVGERGVGVRGYIRPCVV